MGGQREIYPWGRNKNPKRHTCPRNRARQAAARELARSEGITYQQALIRLDQGEMSWWTVPIEITLQQPDEGQDLASATESARSFLTGANFLLGARGEVRATHMKNYSGYGYQPECLISFLVQEDDDPSVVADELLETLAGGLGQMLWGESLVGRNCEIEPVAARRLNTRFRYLYRDADNYKEGREVVLPGEPELGDLETVRAALDGGENFIPEQVGLVDLQAGLQQWDSKETEAGYETNPENDPDHPWHEFSDEGEWFEVVAEEPTESLTFKELVENFRTVTWDESHPYR